MGLVSLAAHGCFWGGVGRSFGCLWPSPLVLPFASPQLVATLSDVAKHFPSRRHGGTESSTNDAALVAELSCDLLLRRLCVLLVLLGSPSVSPLLPLHLSVRLRSMPMAVYAFGTHIKKPVRRTGLEWRPLGGLGGLLVWPFSCACCLWLVGWGAGGWRLAGGAACLGGICLASDLR